MLPDYQLLKSNATDINNLGKTVELDSKTHTVLELHKEFIFNKDAIAFFKKKSEDFKESGMSFVLVHSETNIDLLPDLLNIAPTIEEAEDILEMEAIERDLGF